ncbi:hypothetical protein JTE90_001111 [Oedothorax gibbosus]|uniref:Uncharacterized protein n=1 Tax=Oedothorax gibbosus TaxID=931172 RepID=A0AAV6VJK6_9ARAC|nr:hypothetical protein JTE90_001111 [Oedothorax gibbosus]
MNRAVFFCVLAASMLSGIECCKTDADCQNPNKYCSQIPLSPFQFCRTYIGAGGYCLPIIYSSCAKGYVCSLFRCLQEIPPGPTS